MLFFIRQIGSSGSRTISLYSRLPENQMGKNWGGPNCGFPSTVGLDSEQSCIFQSLKKKSSPQERMFILKKMSSHLDFALVAMSLFAGFMNFLVYSGAARIFLGMLLGRRLPFLRIKKWISNIPGNPSCLDPLLCAFIGPFPELNDFNSVLPGLRLDQGCVLLHGVPPRCRCMYLPRMTLVELPLITFLKT